METVANEPDRAVIKSAASKLQRIAEASIPFTDFLISAGDPITVRNASGWVEESSIEGFSHAEVEALLYTLDPEWERELASGRMSKTMPTESWQLRISAYMAFAGTRPMLSVRRTPRYPLPLDKIGIPVNVRMMLENARGLIFVTGATGAGKTTTMAALVDDINARRRSHIITIEDPIEYMYRPDKAVFSQREVGVDTPSFQEGARAALRQRPDVVVIGEIRDKETMETALLAGESGHLVIATLHANNAYGAIQKILSYFPGEHENRLMSLAANLVGVIHQVVLPHVDGQNIVIASELMFNHKQQFSEHLGNRQKVMEDIDKSADGVSRPLGLSLLEAVKAGKVNYIDAMYALIGQGALAKRWSNEIQAAGKQKAA